MAMLSVALVDWDDSYQDNCQSYHKHHFLDQWVRTDSGPFLLWEFLYRTPWAPRLYKSHCFYDDVVFFSDFPVITASYFITNDISIKLKYNFVRE